MVCRSENRIFQRINMIGFNLWQTDKTIIENSASSLKKRKENEKRLLFKLNLLHSLFLYILKICVQCSVNPCYNEL